MHRTDNSRNFPNRREFVVAGAGAAAIGLTSRTVDAARAESPAHESIIKPGATVLFQGDSITDAGRKRDDLSANSQPAFGAGYAWIAASQLLISRPNDNLKFYNRGIAGNKVFEMADRWQADCLDLKPDVISIMIGVNDFWHKHKYEYPGNVKKYHGDLTKLLERTRQSLPNTRFVICEPFELRIPTDDPKLAEEFAGYRGAAKELAASMGATFVPFDHKFQEASKIAPPLHWAPDGVHPGADASALMAYWWLEATNS